MIGQNYVAFVLAWFARYPFLQSRLSFLGFQDSTCYYYSSTLQDAKCKCKTITVHARKGGWVVTPEGEGFKRRECNLTWPWSSAQHGQWRWMALDATRWWTVDSGQ